METPQERKRETPQERRRRQARERKRAQRNREREARRKARDVTADYIQGSFADYLRDKSLIFDESLHFTGVVVTGSLADEDHSGCYPGGQEWEEIQEVPLNSINRATLMIGALLDAAHELAKHVNAFKRQEIDKRIAEAQQAGADDRIMNELYSIQTSLRREEQHRFPRYRVRGQ